MGALRPGATEGCSRRPRTDTSCFAAQVKTSSTSSVAYLPKRSYFSMPLRTQRVEVFTSPRRNRSMNDRAKTMSGGVVCSPSKSCTSLTVLSIGRPQGRSKAVLHRRKARISAIRLISCHLQEFVTNVVEVQGCINQDEQASQSQYSFRYERPAPDVPS